MPPRRRARPCCRSRGTRTRRRGCCSRGAPRAGGRATRSPRRRRRRSAEARKSRRARRRAHVLVRVGLRGASARRGGARRPRVRGRRVRDFGVGAAPRRARRGATGEVSGASSDEVDPGTAAAQTLRAATTLAEAMETRIFNTREGTHAEDRSRRIERKDKDAEKKKRVRLRVRDGRPGEARRGGGGARRGDHGRVGKNRESVRGLARATATRLGDRTASNACVSSSILTHRSSHRATDRASRVSPPSRKRKKLCRNRTPRRHLSDESPVRGARAAVRSDGMSGRSRLMLGVLGTGVGINLAGTYVLLTSERRVVVGTEAVAKGAEYDGAVSSGASSPPPPRNRNAGVCGETGGVGSGEKRTLRATRASLPRSNTRPERSDRGCARSTRFEALLKTSEARHENEGSVSSTCSYVTTKKETRASAPSREPLADGEHRRVLFVLFVLFVRARLLRANARGPGNGPRVRVVRALRRRSV